MHICMVCMDFPPVARGIGHYVHYLSKKLIEKGHKVTVLTRGSWKGTTYEKIDQINVYRVRFAPTYPFHLQFHGFFIDKLIRQIEPDFDVIHLHNPLVPLVHTSLPTIITEHGTVKGGIAHREILDLFSLGLKIFSKIYVSHEKKLLKNVDKITAVSESCVDEIKTFYGIKDVEITYNGVETNFFVPGDFNEEKSAILYVGSLDARKGLPDLIKSAIYVCKELPDVKFMLVGRGPLKNKLKKMVDHLDLNENVFFSGYLNRDELVKCYQKSTIFVLPSYYEGLPTTIMEAMSCGLPVIATDVLGTSELVVDGKTGFLVPPKSPDKLSVKILDLLNDKNLRKTMGNNSRELIKEKYDWNIIERNIERLYYELKV